MAPYLLNEMPTLAVAALAKGKTVVRDAAELRLKECDRIFAIAPALS